MEYLAFVYFVYPECLTFNESLKCLFSVLKMSVRAAEPKLLKTRGMLSIREANQVNTGRKSNKGLCVFTLVIFLCCSYLQMCKKKKKKVFSKS